MLTVVALLFFPVVFVMSVYRLYQLPRDLLAGKKKLNRPRKMGFAVAVATTYIALGAYTAYLVYAIASIVAVWPVPLSDLLSTASVVVGFPFVYLAFAWVYFHAFAMRKR